MQIKGWAEETPKVMLHSRRFWVLCAVALPLTNVSLEFAIRYSGGAHNHGYLIAGVIAAIEATVIAAGAWFAAQRKAIAWAPVGFLVDFAVSAAAIYAVIFALLIIGHSNGGAA